MGQETIWELGIDGSSAVAAAEEIDAALASITETIDSVLASFGDLSIIDDAMAGIGASVSGAADSLSVLGEDLSATATVADDTSATIEGLNEVIASMASTIADDTSVIDGLNGTITNLQAQVDMLTVSEDAAEVSTSGLASMMAALGEMANNVGNALQKAQGPLMMLGMAGIMVGKSFVDMGMKSEDALNQVQALAGVSASDMATYTTQLEAQATQFGESLDQEAQGLFYVTSAGFQNADAMKVLGQAVEDAKAGHVDLGIAAKALDSSLNAYGASADQATQYNDYMITAVTKGVQTFGDFASAISKAAIAGNAAHISFNQVAAAESELTTVGMTARQASMDLSSMMKALDNDFDKTAATAKKLGLHFDEAKFKTMDLFHQMLYLQDITKGNQTELTKLVGGSAGIAAFNGLMTKNADGTYKFAQSLDNMKNSTGAAAQAFQTSQDTISAHMEKINAAFSVISYKALEALAPTINMVADAVGKAADFMSQHMDIVMPILAGLAVFFGVIIVMAIGAFISSIWLVISPFLAVAAVIGAVVAAVVLAVEHWGAITDWLKGVWNGFMSWFNGILGGVKEKWGELTTFFKGLWSGIVADSKTAWDNVSGAARQGGANLASWWHGVSASFAQSPLGSSLIKTFQDQLGQIGPQLGQIGTNLRTQIGGAISGILPALGNLGNSFNTIFSHAEPIVSGVFMQAWRLLQGVFADIGGVLSSTLVPAWHSLQGALAQLIPMVGGALTNAWRVLSPIIENVGKIIGGGLLTAFQIIGVVIGGVVQAAILVGQQFGQTGTQMRTEIGGALAGIMPALNNLGSSFKLVWGQISQAVQAVSGPLGQLGQMIGGSFSSTWKVLQITLTALWQMLAGPFISTWKILQGTFAALAPVFSQIGALIGGQVMNALKVLGAILGGVILIVIAAVLGAIVGLAKGLATFIQGIAMIITGFIQVWSGLFQIISGFVALIVDLCTGHFNKLGADLGVIWHGVVTMFTGVWNIIKGLFTAVIGTIVSYIQGFVSTIIGFFTNLYNSLVGHSIIPDMINGIISWFEQLPGRIWSSITTLISDIIRGFNIIWSAVIEIVTDLVNGVINWFKGLPQSIMNAISGLQGMISNLWNTIITDATNAGTNIVKGIADGIKNAIHFVTDAIHNVTSWISDHLPHSPAKEGPLRDLLLQGSLITEQISQGMLSNLPKLQATIKQLTNPIALSLNQIPPPSLSATAGSLGGGNNQTNLLLAQMLAAMQVQQRQVLSAPASNTLGAVTQQFGNINVHGVNNVNDLFQQLNQLAGQQLQYSQRGAVFNY